MKPKQRPEDELSQQEVRAIYERELRAENGEAWWKENARYLDAWWERDKSLIL